VITRLACVLCMLAAEGGPTERLKMASGGREMAVGRIGAEECEFKEIDLFETNQARRIAL
jgi:hypothetical protein